MRWRGRRRGRRPFALQRTLARRGDGDRWGIGGAGPVVSDRPVAGYEPSSSAGAKPSSSALSGLLITAPWRTSSIVAICVITPALQGVHAVPARRGQPKRSLGGTRRPRQILSADRRGVLSKHPASSADPRACRPRKSGFAGVACPLIPSDEPPPPRPLNLERSLPCSADV